MTTHTLTIGRPVTAADLLARADVQALFLEALCELDFDADDDYPLFGVPAALEEDASRDGRTVATAPAPELAFGAVATAPYGAVGLDTTTGSRAGILTRSDRPAPTEVR